MTNQNPDIADLPEELRVALDQDYPWKYPEREKPKQKQKASHLRAPLDFSKYLTKKGDMKYTCPMCCCKFVKSRVKEWWIKPAPGRKPIPCCPHCGNAGAAMGWHEEWGEFVKDEPLNLPKYEGYAKNKKNKKKRRF